MSADAALALDLETRGRTDGRVLEARPTIGFGRAAAALLVATACTPLAEREAVAPVRIPLPDPVQGANLREVGDLRRGYGSTTARRTMRRLKTMGVNTLGILVEAQLSDGNDRTLDVERKAFERARQALLDANELGLATVFVPQLRLADGTWRGRLAPDGAPGSERWWSGYREFVLRAARIGEEASASALSLGVELKGLSARAGPAVRMRSLARQAREVFSGPLTYHANWDEADQVRFWDAVDLVGINAYYPLQPDPIRGAEGVAAELAALAGRTDRPVVAWEVGFRSGPVPHLEPWAWPDDVHPVVDQAAQARAWAAVLSAWLPAPGVRGLMIWVVPTDPDDPASEPAHGFNPLNKRAERVIARAFGDDRSRAAR